MRLFLTGANGLLGHKIITGIEQHSELELLATGRGECRSARLSANCQYQAVDITDHASVRSVLKAFKPHAIIHAAAMTQVDDCELNRVGCNKVNVEATQNIATISRDLGAHFHYISTDFVFDGQDGPYSEHDRPSPVNYYGESKLQAESSVQQICKQYSIIRTVLVYGYAPTLSRSNIVLWVYNSLKDGKRIKVVSDQRRTPTLVEDLAHACIQIAEERKAGVWHISGPETLSPYDMAVRIARFFGLDDGLIEKVDASVFTQPGKRPPKTGFVIDKAVNELSFEPKDFTKGFEIISAQIL